MKRFYFIRSIFFSLLRIVGFTCVRKTGRRMKQFISHFFLILKKCNNYHFQEVALLKMDSLANKLFLRVDIHNESNPSTLSLSLSRKKKTEF